MTAVERMRRGLSTRRHAQDRPFRPTKLALDTARERTDARWFSAGSRYEIVPRSMAVFQLRRVRLRFLTRLMRRLRAAPPATNGVHRPTLAQTP